MTITMSGKTIGENIKLARMQAGISRAKLAEELCVSEVMVYKYETDSANNICGIKVKELRKGLRISQHELSNRLIVNGLDIDKNAVQRIESGQRFVTDIEIIYLAKVYISCNILFLNRLILSRFRVNMYTPKGKTKPNGGHDNEKHTGTDRGH